MATYVYETIPQNPKEEPKQVEIEQSMKDDPLKTHPETGEPVRRVVSGGYGFIGSKRELRAGGECCSTSVCDCG